MLPPVLVLWTLNPEQDSNSFKVLNVAPTYFTSVSEQVNLSANFNYYCPICLSVLIVSRGFVQWKLWFNVRYAAVEIFYIKVLRGKLHQLASPNLHDIFIGR